MNNKELSPELNQLEALQRISRLPKTGLFGEIIGTWFEYRLHDVLEMIQDQTIACPAEMRRFLGDDFDYFKNLNFKTNKQHNHGDQNHPQPVTGDGIVIKGPDQRDQTTEPNKQQYGRGYTD